MSGFIYAIESGGRIKLGFSEDPERRFNKIASDAPYPCELLGYWPGGVSDELAVQTNFQGVRVHGEWFAATEELLSFIAAKAVARPPTKRYAITGNETPLLAWRKARRERMEDHAKALGVTQATWSRWENGKLQIAAHHVLKLERLTGIPRHELRPDVFAELAE